MGEGWIIPQHLPSHTLDWGYIPGQKLVMLFKSREVYGVEFRTDYPYDHIKVINNPYLPELTDEGIQAVMDEAETLQFGLRLVARL